MTKFKFDKGMISKSGLLNGETKKEFNFKRNVSIKNLFDSKSVLKFFNKIEFESVEIFLYCIQEDLIKIDWFRELLLPIREEDLDTYKLLFEKGDIFYANNIHFSIYQDQFIKLFTSTEYENLWKKKFNLIIKDSPDDNFPNVLNLARNSEWLRSNPIYCESNITSDNYKKEVQRIIKDFRIKGLRFYDLKFDYFSFLDNKISDLTELEFWLNSLVSWCREEHPDVLVIKAHDFTKPIYVSNNLEIASKRTGTFKNKYYNRKGSSWWIYGHQ